MRLSARTKAPSSRVSSNMVAACVCSVLFMSRHDFKASGRRRLSTVSTMACVQKTNDTRVSGNQHGHEVKRERKQSCTEQMYTSMYVQTEGRGPWRVEKSLMDEGRNRRKKIYFMDNIKCYVTNKDRTS